MDTIETQEVIPNPEVLKALRDWRYQEARQQQIPAYWIMSNTMMQDVACRLPTTPEGLRSLHGLGKSRVEKYGHAILAAVVEGVRASVGPEPSPPPTVEDTCLSTVVYRIPPSRQSAVLAAAGIHGAHACGSVHVKVELVPM